MHSFETPQRAPLFFMHIPKTAGMSMRAYLGDQYSPSTICPANTWPAVRWLECPIGSYRLVQGHFQYNLRDTLDPTTKVVTIVREPLARTLSALHHLQRDPNFHADHAIAKDRSIREILRMPRLMLRQRNVQAASFCASVPVEVVLANLRQDRPEFDVAELEHEPNLELALTRVGEVEFLGSAENLWLLLRQLSGELALHPSAGLPAINAAPGPVVTPASLDGEDLELLRFYNDIDIPLYARCLDIIEQREIQSLMLSMVERGIYKRMDGSFDIDLSGPMPGSGWYAPEREEDRVWRWTGPTPSFTLEVPLHADGRYKVSLQFGGRAIGRNGLVVRANGHDLVVALTESNLLYDAVMVVGPDILAANNGCCRLVFDTGTTAQPSGNELRLLGAAVRRVRFERMN